MPSSWMNVWSGLAWGAGCVEGLGLASWRVWMNLGGSLRSVSFRLSSFYWSCCTLAHSEGGRTYVVFDKVTMLGARRRQCGQEEGCKEVV